MAKQKKVFHYGFRHDLDQEWCFWKNARRYHFAELIHLEDDRCTFAACFIVDAAGRPHPLHIDTPFVYLNALYVNAVYGVHSSGRIISA